MADDIRSERRSLDAVGAYFVGELPVDAALRRICDAALAAEPVAVFAGVSMTVDARLGTYVFTHPDVVDIDRSQYASGEGPCVDAFITGSLARIDSTAAPGPYPAFRRAAAAHGIGSVVSIPMRAGHQVVGALNMYSRETQAFCESMNHSRVEFATHAAYVLLNHQAYWDARSLSENLQAALASRAEIEQAKGIIVATTGCSPDDAFERLRSQSQHENVKVRDLARELIRRSRLPRQG